MSSISVYYKQVLFSPELFWCTHLHTHGFQNMYKTTNISNCKCMWTIPILVWFLRCVNLKWPFFPDMQVSNLSLPWAKNEEVRKSKQMPFQLKIWELSLIWNGVVTFMGHNSQLSVSTTFTCKCYEHWYSLMWEDCQSQAFKSSELSSHHNPHSSLWPPYLLIKDFFIHHFMWTNKHKTTIKAGT